MNRAPLHGAPAQGHPPPKRGPPARGTPLSFGSQDARSNLAVQLAANAGSFKLKKTAVKIVGAAAPSIPFRGVPATIAKAPTVGAAPVPGPVKAKPEEAEGYVQDCHQVHSIAIMLPLTYTH
jgi:protein-S-isoprenylcysteine O-methyltransferase